MRQAPPFYPLGPTGLAKLIWHLPNFARLYWRLLKDRRVSFLPKLMVLMAFVYALSPIDFLPDWLLPVLGQVDDLMVIAVALRLFIPLCPPEVVDDHVKVIDAGG